MRGSSRSAPTLISLTALAALALVGCPSGEPSAPAPAAKPAAVSEPSASPVPPDPEDFTIVLLPDTQGYSQVYADELNGETPQAWRARNGGKEDPRNIFRAQTAWIVKNRDALRIRFTIHLGDVVENGWDGNQWAIASDALAQLSGKVACGVVLGNWDRRQPSLPRVREKEADRCPHAEFLTLIPAVDDGPLEWRRRRYLSDGVPSTKNANSYHEFEVFGTRFGVLCLEENPPDGQSNTPDVSQWAADIARANSTTMIICATHSYLEEEPLPRFPRDPKKPNPGTEPPAKRNAHTDQAVWNRIVRDNPNVFMVLCGHGGVDRTARKNTSGAVIPEIMSDYAGSEKHPPGEEHASGIYNLGGWLRVMRFLSPMTVEVTTYSPNLGRYWCDPKGKPSAVGAHHPVPPTGAGASVAACDSAHCFMISLDRPLWKR